MKNRMGPWLVVAALAALSLAGCGGGPSSEERIETRVAEEQTVAARLTAEAAPPTDTPQPSPTPIPPTPAGEAATLAPTPTSQPSPTPTPPPSATAPPTATNTPVPTPTPTAIVAVPLPVPGATNLVRSTDPNYEGLNLLLPGFSAEEVTDPMVFRGRIGMALSIFSVSSQSQQPGDGVQQVTFSVVDLETDETVFEREETSSLYCLFGGDTLSECLPRDFDQMDFRWPNGAPIYNGDYRVDIFIETDDDDGQWNPIIEIQGALPRPAETGEASFAGQWQTNIATLDLQQEGDQVSGTYWLYGDGQPHGLEGSVSGGVLEGFYESFGGGTVRFELSEDGQRFDGVWIAQGESATHHWCGVRGGSLPPGCGYSGDWESIGDYTPNYPPTLNLVQTGDRVQGTFLNGLLAQPGSLEGRLGTEGTGSQLTLVGRWSIGRSAGDFRWRMVDLNSDQFVGRSVTADGESHQWCGWRPGLSQPQPCYE
jgi:hypothetical protein